MKLIRDNMTSLPWHCEPLKEHVRPVDDTQEHRFLLLQKLMEECGELVATRSPEALLEEAGDIYEILITLCACAGYGRDDLHKYADEKYESRGGFMNGVVLDI